MFGGSLRFHACGLNPPFDNEEYFYAVDGIKMAKIVVPVIEDAVRALLIRYLLHSL